MLKENPMNFIKIEYRSKVLVILIVLTIFILSIFRSLDSPLQSQISPLGVISFELSGSLEKTQQILSSWNSNANLFAAFGLGFDFLFMAVYAATISLACSMISEKHKGWFDRVGVCIGWGAFLAVMFDVIENICLWMLLTGNLSISLPVLAFWCATFKFLIILFGIIYLAVGCILPKGSFGVPELK